MAMKPTLIQALMQRAQECPYDPVFIFRNETWTYEMIAFEAERLARGMAAHGVKPGDRVALHMMNRPEYIVAYYACFRLGAIAAPLRTAFTFAELAPILQRLTPALYIGDAGLYDNIAPISASVLPFDKRFIVGDAEQCRDGSSWKELLLDSAGNDNSFTPAAHEPAVLITTSGTTGVPKFVVHTASTLAETIDLMYRNLEMSDDEVIPVPLAMAHISGLISFLCYVQLGVGFVVLESFDADAVLDAIERHGCTRYLGFPAQFAAMLESQRRKPRDLRSLRLCLTGGDACPIDLQQQVTSTFGAPLYNLWAATEAVANLKFGLRPGPVMRIADGTRFRLVDDKGNDVDDGEAGELLLRAANLFDGYWNDPRATAEALKAGWYHTGDLMQRGEGDELLFVARKKDIIIRGGTNISPIEVEQAIVASHVAVEEAAVVGMPDGAQGQRIVGFVRLTTGADEALVREIRDSLKTRLAAYKLPERLIVIEALPRNALSKVDRKALQAIASDPPRSSATIDRSAPALAERAKARAMRRNSHELQAQR
jgi:acyl-CoA synthetase (AMP-forming)/AMP-acid ligase II